MIHEQTARTSVAASLGFGFAEQMRTADMNRFRNWYDRRCLLIRDAEHQASGEAVAPSGERGIDRLAA